eukprot:COSAG02_NODE_5745_length_4072_cov_9.799899_2_plen_93_part_00
MSVIVSSLPLFEPQRKQYELRGAVCFGRPFTSPTGQRRVDSSNSKPNLTRKWSASTSISTREQQQNVLWTAEVRSVFARQQADGSGRRSNFR